MVRARWGDRRSNEVGRRATGRNFSGLGWKEEPEVCCMKVEMLLPLNTLKGGEMALGRVAGAEDPDLLMQLERHRTGIAP